MSERTVRVNGVCLTESQVREAYAELERGDAEPKAVEPGLYRWHERADADPFAGGTYVIRRKNADGSWQCAKSWGWWEPTNALRSDSELDESVRSGSLVPLQPVEGVEYGGYDSLRRRWSGGRWEYRDLKTGEWRPSSEGAIYWREGRLRPIVPKPWVPTVGEWVQHKTQPWDKARRVTDVCDNVARVKDSVVDQSISNLRPATPDEITAAKRIELVDRLIVRCKADGGVWRYNVEFLCWSRLDCYGYRDGLEYHTLDLDHYDILPEYTVQGAK